MPNDEIENLLQEIGQLLAEDKGYPLDGTLLHAVLADNMVGPSIFKDLGDHILYRRPDLDRLGDTLLDLWYAEDPQKRWAEIEYLIHDGKFDVKFVYADEIAPPEIEDELDRRDRIVHQYFGEKPIVYPPFIFDEDDDHGTQFES
jgi:hypothetical protein